MLDVNTAQLRTLRCLPHQQVHLWKSINLKCIERLWIVWWFDNNRLWAWIKLNISTWDEKSLIWNHPENSMKSRIWLKFKEVFLFQPCFKGIAILLKHLDETRVSRPMTGLHDFHPDFHPSPDLFNWWIILWNVISHFPHSMVSWGLLGSSPNVNIGLYPHCAKQYIADLKQDETKLLTS